MKDHKPVQPTWPIKVLSKWHSRTMPFPWKLTAADYKADKLEFTCDNFKWTGTMKEAQEEFVAI